ncbi:MAG TPA: tripartite tricarboxylate transporter substrate binding protein [Xanthobacteraceae bacterium]|jgi:tripartite-type tricarboxylate transporter receptor subunit TctC|nr:tripartite tricarboxylate transporter substrate binding protein [Xanthobacteraceae bacterium]
MSLHRAAIAGLIALGFAGILAGSATAQDFAGKPIRIIVGLAPGGGTDVTARLIAQRLTASLGTNVYVENKPGGAFEPAYRELTGAAPDGRTLFFISTATVVAQPSTKDYPFDVRKMAAVTEVGRGPFILTARKELGFHDINDLVGYAKKNPGKLTFASGGGATGSFSLSVELLRLAGGINVVNVPYKGSAEALTDLLGGRIDAMFDATPIEIPQVKSGAVSGVAVTGRERLAALPQVGTFAEGGFPVFADVSNYYVILATPGTPPAVAQTLRDAIAKAVTAPDVMALFDKQGMKPTASQPADTAHTLAADLARWTGVMAKAGIEAK